VEWVQAVRDTRIAREMKESVEVTGTLAEMCNGGGSAVEEGGPTPSATTTTTASASADSD
jgi:hypothetical protein